MIVYLIGSDQVKLKYTHEVYPLKTNPVRTGAVVSKSNDQVYKTMPVVQKVSAKVIVAANGPSAYHEETSHVYVYNNHESDELVGILPDHKVTWTQVSTWLAVKFKTTTPLIARYPVDDQLESKLIHVKVGISLFMVNVCVS